MNTGRDGFTVNTGQAPVWVHRLAATAPPMRALARHVRLSATSRSISGTIGVLEVPSTSRGVVLHAGALQPREPLDRVKLLRDHDPRLSIGFMTSFDADTLDAELSVAEGDAGDEALRDAGAKTHDGLSVGFSAKQFAYDDLGNMHVYEAELYEVSLVALPDFPDAQVKTVNLSAHPEGNRMNPQQLALALAAGTIDQATHDAQLAAWTTAHPPVTLSTTDPAPQPPAGTPASESDPTPPAPGAGVPVQLATQRPGVVPASAPPAYTQPVQLSLRTVAERVRSAFGNLQGNRGTNVQLALQDITPANDAGHGFIGRADWIGELWTASRYSRPWIDAIGAPAELSTVTRKGFRWVDRPTVAEYAGGKAEVPTSTAQTEDEEFTAFRWAGGWDIDRIFLDLAPTPGYLEAFWQAATDEYKAVSNASIRTRVLAAATVPTGTTSSVASGVVALLKQLVRDARKVEGVELKRIFLGADLFEELEDLDVGGTAALPLWLKSANVGMSITEGTADVGPLSIQYDAALAARQAVAFDPRALVVRERQPFQLKAFDVAHAGVDLGFYSYGMLEVHDARAVLKRTQPTV